MRGDRFGINVGGPLIEPKWAALRRAVRAVFDLHDRAHARWYTYSELGSSPNARSAVAFVDEGSARSAYRSDQEAPGERYTALFDAADPTWPDPIFHAYHPAYTDRVAVAGLRSDIVGYQLGPRQAAIYGQTNGRFWNETHYKPGLNLNPRDPEDARWIPTWQRIYHEVLAEVYAGLRTHTDPPWMDYSASAATAREARPGSTIPDRWHPGQTIDAPISGASRSSIDAAEALNHAADALFWAEWKYKSGKRLDRNDPFDRAMIPRWIEARERVARDPNVVKIATDLAQRRKAVGMVSSRFGKDPAPYYVYIEDNDGGFVSAFPSWDLASLEYARISESHPIYVAFFGSADSRWPNPLYESRGVEPVHIIPNHQEKSPGNPGAEGRPVAMSNPTGIISGHRGYQAPRGGGHWRAPFRDRLAYLAPVAYPAAAGAGIQFRIEGDTLVASICVDGRCYDGRFDLGEILSRRGVDSFEQPVDAQTAQDAAQEVSAAGDVLVGCLLDDHVDQVVGGWWDDISKAVHGAERAITGTVASTLKTLKGPITQAAQMAIPALASVIPGGSMIAPMATKLVGELMTAATGSGPAKAQAQQAVAQVRQAAHAGDAAAKKALSLAQRAVAKSSTTYHAAQTAANAASGNPDAQAQISELQGAASSGDQAANALLALIQKLSGQVAAASQAPGGQPATPAAAVSSVANGMDPASALGAAGSPAAEAADSAVDPNDPSATVAQVSGIAASGRQAASAVAVAEHLRSHAPAIAVVFQSNGVHVGLPMESLDAADDWMGRLEPGTFTYAAYFDPADPTWPAPINERVGAKVVSAGWLAPVLAAAGGFGLGAAGWPFIGPKLTSMWGRASVPAAVPQSPAAK